MYFYVPVMPLDDLVGKVESCRCRLSDSILNVNTFYYQTGVFKTEYRKDLILEEIFYAFTRISQNNGKQYHGCLQHIDCAGAGSLRK